MTLHFRAVVIIALATAGLALATVRICADGGAMAGAYRSCDCFGLEWKLYDRTAADGPRRTVCFGWTRSWTCYAFRSDPRSGVRNE